MFAVLALVALAGCSDGAGPSPSAASSSAPAPTASESATASAIPAPSTTLSPLSFIAGGPAPGPLAARDPRRPRYDASVNIDPPSSAVSGSVVVTFTPDLPVAEMVFRLWANAPV